MSRRRLLAIVLGSGALFCAAMLVATGGRPSLPLDDSFIYFQYARQAAAGQPFVYQPGEAPTTGATSVPWMLLLSAGALLGFGGKAMIFFAMAAGGVCLALAARGAGETEGALEPGSGGGIPLAAVLVLVSGPLQWAAWSGMEISLFAAAIVWGYLETTRSSGAPGRRSAIALAALALVRPEGSLLALAAVALQIFRAALDPAERRGLAWVALPVAAALAQPLLSLALTGETRSAGFLSKSLLAAPGYGMLDVVRIALLRAASLGAALFGGIAPLADGRGLYAYDTETAILFVAPGALLLFAIGVLPALAAEWEARRPGAATLALLWIGGMLLATCTLEEPDAHYSRYQMPVLPVFLVWVARGVGRVAQAVPLARLAPGIRIWLVAWGIVSVAFFAGAFADNSRDIDRMQIALGESLRETLEPGDVVAINDAGAIAYFSRRRILDLVGLVTPGLAGVWTAGSGALWESLESRPAPDRPSWFCIFPNWFELDGIGLMRRKGSVRLLAPSIVDAEKVLSRADWSMAGSGDLPRTADPTAVVDRLDVADLVSEAAHGFSYRHGRPGEAGTFVRRAAFASHPDDEAVDGGRTVFGEVAFRIGRDPIDPAGVIVRTVTGARQRLLASVDDGPEHEVELYSPGAGRFHEQVVAVVPPGPGTARVRLRLSPEPAGSAPLILLHVFAVTDRSP